MISGRTARLSALAMAQLPLAVQLMEPILVAQCCAATMQ